MYTKRDHLIDLLALALPYMAKSASVSLPRISVLPSRNTITNVNRKQGVIVMNYSKLLRNLRAHPGLCDHREDKVRRLIKRCKARLAPIWQERADKERADAEQRFMFRWS